MTSEEDAWAQTRITVTPEDDATIREIAKSTVLSSAPDIPLILDDKIIYRRSFSRIQFPEAKELKDSTTELKRLDILEPFIPKQDAGNQTYLQGTRIVRISAEYKDEATQTVYMTSPCPPLTYFKDILTSMDEVPMPTQKSSAATGTIISFPPDALQNTVTQQLSTNIPEKELEEFVSDFSNEENASSEILDILHFLLARAFWIIDPSSQKKGETTEKETQTSVKFNYQTNTLVNDSETQTELTCEPKKSNTMLLSNYWETKNIIANCLEDCLCKGIENKIFVDEIINEIIDKCIKRIKYPMKDQTMQTIVTYRAHGEREEDILRKLRRGIVVDPMEASIVVVPLMNDLLQTVSDTVSKNAPMIAKYIVEIVLRRTMTIVAKLMELQRETQPKPIDHKLAQRRKKILDSMLQKETETVYTQTNIGGVSEIQKVKDKEVVCSICRRPSVCQWCADSEGDVSREDTKILRTEDILLAYKPCYIITTTSEKEKSLQLSYQPVKKIHQPLKPSVNISDDSTHESGETINVFPEAEIMPQESINEWSYVLDTTLMKPLSIGETISTSSRTINSSDKMNSCITSKVVPRETANALEILKNTFCNQETCITSSRKNFGDCYLPRRRIATCIKSTCEACLNRSSSTNRIYTLDTCSIEQACKPPSKLHLPMASICKRGTSSQIYMKSYDNSFKVIPVNLSQISNTQKVLK
nr:uncharacterized protein LOC116427226 [Nomia melanderi]